MRVGKEIALEARKQGLCDQWYKEMMNINTFKELCVMYFKGDDWAMEKDFPNTELSRKFKGEIAPYGLMADDENHYSNPQQIAFLGNSNSVIKYSGFSVGLVIVRHNSKVKIKAFGNSMIYINTLDNAEVNIECEDEAVVVIYDYGKNTKIVSQGNVKIVQSKWEK